jgi:hypothetical protein
MINRSNQPEDSLQGKAANLLAWLKRFGSQALAQIHYGTFWRIKYQAF